MTERESGADGQPLESAGNGKSTTVPLTPRLLGRAIGYCVAEFNTVGRDLCVLANDCWRAAGDRIAWDLSYPAEHVRSPYPKHKKKGSARLSNEQETHKDSKCKTDDWERRCHMKRQTWEPTINSETCHPSRGVGLLSNREPSLSEMGRLALVKSSDLNGDLPDGREKLESNYMRRLSGGLKPHARRRGTTRAVIRKEAPAAVEQSLAAKVLFFVAAMLVCLCFATSGC